MPQVTFITRDGERIIVENASGTLMETAVAHGVPGIEGACGGVCSCATCHVHVEPEWVARVGPRGEDEQDLLDLEDNATEGSRLSCQIEITGELDGLVVRVANP